MITTKKILGSIFKPNPNTTLNSKYAVVEQNSGDFTLEYFGIGAQIGDKLNPVIVQEYVHSSLDCDLFFPIPFLLKPITSPLTPEEISNYQMRTTIEINGVPYFACFLKKFSTNTADGLYDIQSDKDIYTLDKHIVDAKYLKPTPLKRIDLHPDKNTFIGYNNLISLQLSDEEVKNIENNIKLMYPLKDLIIGELGLYSGKAGSDVSDCLLCHTVEKTITLTDKVAKTIKVDIGGMLHVGM